MSLVYLDSRDSSNPELPYNTSWTLNTSVFSDGPTSIDLMYAMFCNGVTAFTSTSNTIAWTEQASPTVLTVTIDSAAYAGSSLADILSADMTAASLATGQVQTYTVTFDEDTLKMTWTADNTFAFITTSNDAYYQLGVTTLDGAVGLTAVGDQIVRLDGPEYIDIEADIHALQGLHTSGTAKMILARIPLTVPFGCMLYFEPINRYAKCLYKQLNNATIRISMKYPDGTFFQLPDNCPVSYILKASQ